MEVHVEPQLPAPVLTLYGDSPVSRALAAMAPAAGYRVRAVGVEDAAAYGEAEVLERGEASTGAGDAAHHAVVATMGEWDEDGARAALDAGAGYVGLVASPRRAGAVRERLEAAGAEPGGRLVSPAGLDLGAREPGEIAVSILAELVEIRARRRGEATSAGGPGEAGHRAGDRGAPSAPEAGSTHAAAGHGAGPAAADGDAGTDSGAVDPVCGMTVPLEDDPPAAEHDGVVYRFCCGGCRARFVEDPDRFAAAAGTS